MDNEDRARRIRMIIMDVDGTLTDGTLFVFPNGEEVKAYNVRDGLGIILARLAGFKTGIITGKSSPGLEKRAEKLRIDELYQGILDKSGALEDILRRQGLSPKEVAYIGDDLSDVEVMKTVGLSAAVADAHSSVKEAAHYLCSLAGGRGAVREFIEFILEAQGKWESLREKVKNLRDDQASL